MSKHLNCFFNLDLQTRSRGFAVIQWMIIYFLPPALLADSIC